MGLISNISQDVSTENKASRPPSLAAVSAAEPRPVDKVEVSRMESRGPGKDGVVWCGNPVLSYYFPQDYCSSMVASPTMQSTISFHMINLSQAF